MRWLRRLRCRLWGHDYYTDNIGGAIFRFCRRCDVRGECLFDIFAGEE